MTDLSKVGEEFDVGGVRLARPFKLLRLGHFGVNVADPRRRAILLPPARFRVSDRSTSVRRAGGARQARPRGRYFTGTRRPSRWCSSRAGDGAGQSAYRKYPELTVNQMDWQVSSLREVVNGFEWFKAR